MVVSLQGILRYLCVPCLGGRNAACWRRTRSRRRSRTSKTRARWASQRTLLRRKSRGRRHNPVVPTIVSKTNMNHTRSMLMLSTVLRRLLIFLFPWISLILVGCEWGKG